MPVFRFRGAILLVCVWTGDMVDNANLVKKRYGTCDTRSPIGLHIEDFPIKKTFNSSLEPEKNLLNVRFVFKAIDPCEFTEIIYKTHIKF